MAAVREVDRVFPLDQIVEIPPPHEQDPARFFADMLSGGYLKEPISEAPPLELIPYVLEELLAPVITKEYVLQAEDGGLAAELTSGVPKWLVGQVVSKEVTNDRRFWQFPIFFQQQAWEEKDDKTKRVLQYLSHGPADIDIKLDINPHQGLASIGKKIAETAGFKTYQIKSIDCGQKKDGERGMRYYTSIAIGYRGTRFDLSFGSIPENPDRQGMEIRFYDPVEKSRILFLAHIGCLPEKAQDTQQDRRSGELNEKQDFCVARLWCDDQGRINYGFEEEAISVMERVDRLPRLDILETKSVGDLAEMSFRALRMNLLHRVNLTSFIIDNNLFANLPEDHPKYSLIQQLKLYARAYGKNSRGFKAEEHNMLAYLYNQNFIFPLIESGIKPKQGSIFDLRQAVQGVSQKDGSLPENPKLRDNILRELFLSLTIDPYSTILFLRDSGMSSLIPGLSHLTRDDWNKVLTHPDLCMTIESGGRRITSSQDEDYLIRQIKAYLSGNDLNGVEMFVNALRNSGLVEASGVGRSCWANLYYIFNEKQLVKRRDVDKVKEKLLGVEEAQSFQFTKEPEEFDDKGYRVIGSTDMGGEECLLLRRSPVPFARRTEFMESMREAFTSYGLVESKPFAGVVNKKIIETIIEQMMVHPEGLTAREIQRLLPPELQENFNVQFLLLKLSGAVQRQSVDRGTRYKHVENGSIKRMDFYSLRLDLGQATGTVRLNKIKEFNQCFMEVSGKSMPATRWINGFARGRGIVSIEVMQSLTEEDYKLMYGVPKVSKNSDLAYQMAAWICEAYEKYRQGRV
ncbi:hypothetical protein ACFLZ1_03740 [Patescibacteria group bacterium]